MIFFKRVESFVSCDGGEKSFFCCSWCWYGERKMWSWSWHQLWTLSWLLYTWIYKSTRHAFKNKSSILFWVSGRLKHAHTAPFRQMELCMWAEDTALPCKAPLAQAAGTCAHAQSSTRMSRGHSSGGCLCSCTKLHSCKWSFACEHSPLARVELHAWTQEPAAHTSGALQALAHHLRGLVSNLKN